MRESERERERERESQGDVDGMCVGCWGWVLSGVGVRG